MNACVCVRARKYALAESEEEVRVSCFRRLPVVWLSQFLEALQSTLIRSTRRIVHVSHHPSVWKLRHKAREVLLLRGGAASAARAEGAFLRLGRRRRLCPHQRLHCPRGGKPVPRRRFGLQANLPLQRTTLELPPCKVQDQALILVGVNDVLLQPLVERVQAVLDRLVARVELQVLLAQRRVRLYQVQEDLAAGVDELLRAALRLLRLGDGGVDAGDGVEKRGAALVQHAHRLPQRVPAQVPRLARRGRPVQPRLFALHHHRLVSCEALPDRLHQLPLRHPPVGRRVLLHVPRGEDVAEPQRRVHPPVGRVAQRRLRRRRHRVRGAAAAATVSVSSACVSTQPEQPAQSVGQRGGRRRLRLGALARLKERDNRTVAVPRSDARRCVPLLVLHRARLGALCRKELDNGQVPGLRSSVQRRAALSVQRCAQLRAFPRKELDRVKPPRTRRRVQGCAALLVFSLRTRGLHHGCRLRLHLRLCRLCHRRRFLRGRRRRQRRQILLMYLLQAGEEKLHVGCGCGGFCGAGVRLVEDRVVGVGVGV
eukprot:Rhum_TRINITY_DN10928_c1_g1::Rhum_TRINITY_DN10928_c1_g1_i1::g.41429::m.41429